MRANTPTRFVRPSLVPTARSAYNRADCTACGDIASGMDLRVGAHSETILYRVHIIRYPDRAAAGS